MPSVRRFQKSSIISILNPVKFHTKPVINKRNTLPIIDIRVLYDDKPEIWVPVDQAIGKACETIGGFMAVGLPAPLKPESKIIEKLFSLFDLSQPVLYEMGKREMCPTSRRCMRGYVDRRAGGFAYNEIFDIGPEMPASGPGIDDIELVTETNVWPSVEPAPNWREEMTARFTQMEALGVRIIRAMARYLNVNETTAAARYQNSSSSMRLLKYPGNPTGQNQNVIGKKHTDNGGLTFQWQDQPGLQIKTPTGEWLDVPERSEGLSVHLGEALETQSSRKFVATPHRVLGWDRVRHSIVFFLEPNLFSSTNAFSENSCDETPSNDETYAASMINTLRKTGRA
ncbi:MAG: hypothetical protein OES20_00010 [Gammaproteobacteria bacterium]|nr:hypothetical protein [Gammaproteobacteria bacterium]